MFLEGDPMLVEVLSWPDPEVAAESLPRPRGERSASPGILFWSKLADVEGFGGCRRIRDEE
jgi:hypothetical protein